MGIDANILVRRVAADRVDDAWLDAISAGLCRDIGQDRFLSFEEECDDCFDAAASAWQARFAAHPLYVALSLCDDTDQRKRELGELIEEDLGPCRARGQRVIQRSSSCCREPGDPPPGSRYQQDGPPIDADPGECLLEINLFSRYYDEDYARGDPILIAAVADWLDAQIPGCEVWYGGDSSGVLAAPFGRQRRRQLIEHARVHGDPSGYWQPPARTD
ncbi:hypothetical protein [Pseudomonas sp. CGJS7]|uniref:hypothetical protein n=1 Tax=Pseudomonas sp. CGJS7 TaxID=3109348 RepID=UPI00300ABB81